jgi:hypothetical protein
VHFDGKKGAEIIVVVCSKRCKKLKNSNSENSKITNLQKNEKTNIAKKKIGMEKGILKVRRQI